MDHFNPPLMILYDVFAGIIDDTQNDIELSHNIILIKTRFFD